MRSDSVSIPPAASSFFASSITWVAGQDCTPPYPQRYHHGWPGNPQQKWRLFWEKRKTTVGGIFQQVIFGYDYLMVESGGTYCTKRLAHSFGSCQGLLFGKVYSLPNLMFASLQISLVSTSVVVRLVSDCCGTSPFVGRGPKDRTGILFWRFPKIGVPPVIIHLNGTVHYTPSIWWYPHLWKPPYRPS